MCYLGATGQPSATTAIYYVVVVVVYCNLRHLQQATLTTAPLSQLLAATFAAAFEFPFRFGDIHVNFSTISQTNTHDRQRRASPTTRKGARNSKSAHTHTLVPPVFKVK